MRVRLNIDRVVWLSHAGIRFPELLALVESSTHSAFEDTSALDK